MDKNRNQKTKMSKFYKIFGLMIGVAIFFILNANVTFAADRYWVGSTTSFNSSSNWSTINGGSGGAGVPGSSDTAIFTDRDLTNCVISSTESIGAMEIWSGYTGIVAVGTGGRLTSGNMDLDDGILRIGGTGLLSAGDVTLGTDGVFDHIGTSNATMASVSIGTGDFTAPSGNLYINGGMSISKGGVFTHNSGTVYFNDNDSGTISMPNDFYNVRITKTGGTLSNTSTLSITNNLTITAGTFTGGTQNITVEGIFSQSGGSFTSTTATFQVDGNFSKSSGTFSHNSGTVEITGTSIVSAPSTSFNNFSIAAGATETVSLGNNLDVNGNLTINSGTLDVTTSAYDINLEGNWTLTSGTAAFTFRQGTVYMDGNKNAFINMPSIYFYNLEIDKDTGYSVTASNSVKVANFYMNSGTFNGQSYEHNNWFLTITGGTFNSTSGTMYLWYGMTKSGGTFNHNNGTVEFNNGISYITVPSTTFNNVIIDNSNVDENLYLESDMDIDGDFTLQNGVFNINGAYDMNVAGDWTKSGGTFTPGTNTVFLDGSNQSINGSTSFYNLSKEATGADTLTFESGETQTITNTLTLKGTPTNDLVLTASSTTDWYIDPEATRDIQYLDVSQSNNIDNQYIGTAGLDIEDSGSNTGWNFTNNIYWVNDDNDKNYSNGNNWSNSSGGPGGAGIPTSAHVIVYDGAGLNGDSTCTINTNITLSGISITSGFTDVVGSNAGLTYVINGPTTLAGGTLSLPSSGTITHNDTLTITNANYLTSSSTIILNASLVLNTGSNLNATSATYIDINDTSDTAVDFNAGSFTAPFAKKIYVAGNWDQETGTTFNHNNGTIEFDGTHTSRSIYVDGSPEFYNITINKDDSADRMSMQNDLDLAGTLRINKGILNSNSNDINLEYHWYMADTNASFTAGTSTVTMDGTNQSFFGSTTFYNFSKTGAAGTLTFEAGDTQTFTNNMTLRGLVGGKLNLESSISGTQAMIDPQNVRDVKNLTVKDNYNINASDIETDGLFIKDNGNNDGWNFTEPIPEFSTYLLALLLLSGIYLSKNHFTQKQNV